MALPTSVPANIDAVIARDQQFAAVGHGDAVAVTFNATLTKIDCRAGSEFFLTMGAASITLLSMLNPQPGQVIDLLVKQDSGGSRTITWDSVLWAGGSAPTLTTTASATDWLRFTYNATLGFWLGETVAKAIA